MEGKEEGITDRDAARVGGGLLLLPGRRDLATCEDGHGKERSEGMGRSGLGWGWVACGRGRRGIHMGTHHEMGRNVF